MANNLTRVRYLPLFWTYISRPHQLQTRTRFGARKGNGDENATSKHLRQTSGIASTGASRASTVLSGLKVGAQRPALNEVTTTAVNRKVSVSIDVHPTSALINPCTTR